MDTLIKQLSPLAAVLAAAFLNIINYVAKSFVPAELLNDVGILLQVAVMAIIIYASNLLTKFAVGVPAEKAVERRIEAELIKTGSMRAVSGNDESDAAPK